MLKLCFSFLGPSKYLFLLAKIAVEVLGNRLSSTRHRIMLPLLWGASLDKLSPVPPFPRTSSEHMQITMCCRSCCAMCSVKSVCFFFLIWVNLGTTNMKWTWGCGLIWVLYPWPECEPWGPTSSEFRFQIKPVSNLYSLDHRSLVFSFSCGQWRWACFTLSKD